MKLRLFISLFISFNIFDVIRTNTSTVSTTKASSPCAVIYVTDSTDVCEKGLFYIEPEISQNENDATLITYAQLESFTVIPGNASCSYDIEWRTTEGTFSQLQGNVLPGVSQICAVNVFYTSCGYIFLEDTTTTKTTTETTTVEITSASTKLSSTTILTSTSVISSLTSTSSVITEPSSISSTSAAPSSSASYPSPTVSLSSSLAPASTTPVSTAPASTAPASTTSTSAVPASTNLASTVLAPTSFASTVSASTNSAYTAPVSTVPPSTALPSTQTPVLSTPSQTTVVPITTSSLSSTSESALNPKATDSSTFTQTVPSTSTISTATSTPFSVSTNLANSSIITSSVRVVRTTSSTFPSTSLSQFYRTFTADTSTVIPPTPATPLPTKSSTTIVPHSPSTSLLPTTTSRYFINSISTKTPSSTKQTTQPDNHSALSETPTSSYHSTSRTSPVPSATSTSFTVTTADRSTEKYTPFSTRSSSTLSNTSVTTTSYSSLIKSSTPSSSTSTEVTDTRSHLWYSTPKTSMPPSSSVIIISSTSFIPSTISTTSIINPVLTSTPITSTVRGFTSPTSTQTAPTVKTSSSAYSQHSTETISPYHTRNSRNSSSSLETPTLPYPTSTPQEEEEERKKNEQIAQKIEELTKPKNESSNNIIDKIVRLDKDKVIELIKNQATGSSEVDKNFQEYIESIAENLTSVNEEQAQAIESVLNDIDMVEIKSPNIMFELLGNMDHLIKNSNGFTIDPYQKFGDQFSTYIAEYGVMSGDNINAVLHACSVSIEGSNVFFSGTIIPSKIQTVNTPTHLLYYPDNTMEMTGEFQNWTSVSVARGNFELKKLSDSLSMVHFNGMSEIEISSDEYNPSVSCGLELWNASLVRVSAYQQKQINVSLTAYINIENLHITLLVSKSSMSDLHDGIPQPVIGCSFRMTLEDQTHIIQMGEGTIYLRDSDDESQTIVYRGSILKATPEYEKLHKLLYTPLSFKNVDVRWSQEAGVGQKTILLRPAEGKIININVVMPESSLPSVQSRYSAVNRTSLIIKSPTSLDSIREVLKNGGKLILEGEIALGNQLVGIKNKSAEIEKKSLIIYLNADNPLHLINVVFELRTTTPEPILHILSSQYSAPSISHHRTVLSFNGKGEMYFTEGTLLRNETDGILIIGTLLQVSSDFSAPSFNVIPQSLFTQQSYEYITSTMSKVKDFLKNNSYSLTVDELEKGVTQILDTTSSLIDSLKSSAKSPLPSDVAKNLLYEKNNYDDIFNTLPENADNIRYVEEMTEEEWAAEATSIVQKKMAKDLLDQTSEILNTLVDTIATKKIERGEVPFLIEFTGTGMEVMLTGGTSEYVLNVTYMCENWEVEFPKKLEDLNVINIGEDDIIRADFVCYSSNNYYFVDDYDELIVSGSVDVKLKTGKSEPIQVKGAKSPIVLTGEYDNDNINPLITLASNSLDEMQILDFRSFIVTAWNTSLTIEIRSSKYFPGEQKILFLGYQSQPGPRQGDHEYSFILNGYDDENRFFISSEKLYNMTGLYILGVGTKVKTMSNDTVVYKEEDKPSQILAPFQFKQDSSEFYARVLTKGCYAYNPETNRMDSTGIAPIDTPSSTRVTCHSKHLTSFSIGIKNPEVAAKYAFQFTVDIVPKNTQPIILIVTYTIFLLITFYNCCTVERLDTERGDIQHLKDNHPADEYIYIMAVFTGFRQFSSSQSKICFNITGEDGNEIGRSLETQEPEKKQLLKWGTCSRFLMTTHWPMGNLKYIRLWIEKPGEEQSEAWFCTKVMILDVQTRKKYTFPVHSWLGRTNEDEQTDRLSQEKSCASLIEESTSFHNILEQITYIAMFLGGTGLSRARLERDVYILSIWFSLSVTTTILSFTSHLMNKKTNGHFIYDAATGICLSLFLTLVNMILPYIANKSYTMEENDRVNYYKNSYKNYVEVKGQYKPIVKALTTTLIKTLIMILLIVNTVRCFSLSEPYASVFTRRFLMTLFLWIILFEPLKGCLLCMKNIKKNRIYQLSTATELSFLPIKALTDFYKCPKEIVDKSTGSSYADLSKLRASKDNRMRDEMLFHTVREIIFLLFTLAIFCGLTYLLRDRFGYHYHHQVKNNFNLETEASSFSKIKSIDGFWNWANHSLVDGLMSKWPDMEPAYDMRGFVNDKASRSMGTGILRQIRSMPHKCDFILPKASSEAVCVEDIWAAGYDTTAQFDPSWLPYTNSSEAEFIYRTSDLLQSYSIMGQLGTYEGGGYVVSLQGTADDLRTKFERLKNQSWIDKETRAVFVELSLYNAQINYFCVLQLVLEIPRTKFCLPTVWVETMRLIRGDEDTINETIEWLYICYCVIKFALEFFYIIHDRFHLFGTHLLVNPLRLLKCLLIGSYDLWQTMDFFVGSMSFASVITYFMKLVYVKEAVDSFTKTNGNAYINLTRQRDVQLMFNYSFAIVVFFVSCKLMKILRFNHRIGVLADTLESATTGISDYGQGFLCILNAFILAMMHLLGNSLEGYYSYIVSLQTLVSSLLGKLGGGKVYDTSILGSTYFLLFMLIGTVLLLNVFVMIIMYEFELVRTNADRLANNYEIIEHVSYKVRNELGMLARSNKVSVALQDQYCEAPVLQRLVCKIYLAIYRTNRLYNMNRLKQPIDREARIESVPDVLRNATVLRS